MFGPFLDYNQTKAQQQRPPFFFTQIQISTNTEKQTYANPTSTNQPTTEHLIP